MERKFTKEHNDLGWLFPEIPNAYIPSGETAVSFIDKPDIKENIIHKAANHAAAYCCDLVDLIKHVVKNINIWEIRESQTLPSACSEMLGKENTSAVENKACIFAICLLLVYDCTYGEFK